MAPTTAPVEEEGVPPSTAAATAATVAKAHSTASGGGHPAAGEEGGILKQEVTGQINAALDDKETTDLLKEPLEGNEANDGGGGDNTTEPQHEQKPEAGAGHEGEGSDGASEALCTLLGGGAGDLPEQFLIGVSFVQTFALFTMPGFIGWPEGWLDWIRWTQPFAFGLDVDLLLPDGEWPGLALAVRLAPPPLLLARMYYLREFLFVTKRNSQGFVVKDNMAAWREANLPPAAWHRTRGRLAVAGVLAPCALLAVALAILHLMDELVSPVAGSDTNSDSGFDDGVQQASGSGDEQHEEEQELTATAAMCVLVAGTWCAIGLLVLLHRVLLRRLYASILNRGEAKPYAVFGATWAYGEGSVLLFLYLVAYIGPVAACLDVIGAHEGDGFVPAVMGGTELGALILTALVAKFAAKDEYGDFEPAFFFLGLHFSDPAFLGALGCSLCALLAAVVCCFVLSSSGLFVVAWLLGPFYLLAPLGVLSSCAFMLIEDYIEKEIYNPFLGRLGNSRAQKLKRRRSTFTDETDRNKKFQKAVKQYKEQAKRGEGLDGDNGADAFMAAFLGLVVRYERKYWLARPAMLLEKAVIAAVVLLMEGRARLWVSLGLAVGGVIAMAAARPYDGDAQDRTELMARLSLALTVGVGCGLELEVAFLPAAETVEMILIVNSIVVAAWFAISLGPLRAPKAVFDEVQDARARAAWQARSEADIQAMKPVEIERTLGSKRQLQHVAAKQRAWMLAYHLETIDNIIIENKKAVSSSWCTEQVSLAGVGSEATTALVKSIGKMSLVRPAGVTSLNCLKTSLNCLANEFEIDGLATLVTAIEGTSIRSLCGLTEGQTKADFSGQNLGPSDCKIMKAEFDFRGFIATLNCLTVDSTGGPKFASQSETGPRTYTLTVGEKTIDLSSKNLGVVDVNLVAVWIKRPEVSAVGGAARATRLYSAAWFNTCGRDSRRLMH